MTAALNLRAIVALEILQAHFADHGVLPPQYKVALKLGLSPSSTDIVRAAYMALEDAGLIRRLSRGWHRIKLIQPEYDDPADLARCASPAARYSKHLQLVQSLHVAPPDSLTPKLRGLKPLSKRTRVFWQDGFPAAPTGSAA